MPGRGTRPTGQAAHGSQAALQLEATWWTTGCENSGSPRALSREEDLLAARPQPTPGGTCAELCGQAACHRAKLDPPDTG